MEQFAGKPQRLLGEGLLASARSYPEKAAIVVEGNSYSYKQLADAALRMASTLQKKGLKRGERVAIYMDNTWPCVVSVYGVLLAGGVFFIINPQTKAEKLSYVLEDSETRFLLSDGHISSVFFQALQDISGGGYLIYSGELKEVHSCKWELSRFDDEIRDNQATQNVHPCIPNDLAALVYTSGSTGKPKGVMLTHQAMVFAAWSLIEYLRLSADDRILLVLPLAFDYGLYQLLMSIKLGATLIIERSFTFPAQVYKRIRDEQVTVFPGVPTIYSMMTASNRKKELSFPSVKRVTNTAAALNPALIPELKKVFPNALIYKMYGLTECKRVSYLEPELVDDKPASVGKAIPGTEVFLLSTDGLQVAPGDSGILHVRGPHIMAGYLNQPELSEKMLKPGPLPGERMLCTHDLFRMDEEGFLYFVGRSDDIIKTRGEKVSPIEVEHVLQAIPGIKEAAVIGVRDETLGQAIKAFIVGEGDEYHEKQLQKLCLAQLENFMVPQSITYLEELPKSQNGKVDKKQLMEMVEK